MRIMASRIARRGLALALFAPLLACAPQPEPPAPKGDVIIGGHSYRLPDAAFADGLVDHGPQDQLLLELPVPVKAGVKPATVQLLLTAPRTADEQERERQVLDHVRISAHIRAADLDHRGDKFKALAGPSLAGLVPIVTHQDSSMQKADVFVKPPLASPVEFIACDQGDKDASYPMCDHEFTATGFEVKASYGREYKNYLDEIRRYVITYLRDHRAS